jgi:hypothetical protein
MKTNITKIGAALLGVGICLCFSQLRAQTTTTVTTTKGAFTEFVPDSKTVVVRTEASTPLRYVVTKQTTIVDETGAPVTVERIAPGSPLSVEYTGTGENLVASRIVVQKPAAVSEQVTTTAPVTTAPVTTAPVVSEQHTTTTTATTRTLTHDEKEALKDERKARKEAAKEEIERRKDALEKAKDKLEDDDH